MSLGLADMKRSGIGDAAGKRVQLVVLMGGFMKNRGRCLRKILVSEKASVSLDGGLPLDMGFFQQRGRGSCVSDLTSIPGSQRRRRGSASSLRRMSWNQYYLKQECYSCSPRKNKKRRR